MHEELASATEEEATSQTSSELMDGAEQCENLVFDLATLPTDLGNTASHLISQNLHTLRRIGDKQYDLWNGKKNVDSFVKQLSLHVRAKPPDVNISELVEQYNDRENRFGLPATRADGEIEQERPRIIFKKTLDKEKE